MAEDNKCKGIFGFLFGHNFETIYNRDTDYQDINISEPEFAHIIKLVGGYQTPILKDKKTYKKSICRRCGKVINIDILK